MEGGGWYWSEISTKRILLWQNEWVYELLWRHYTDNDHLKTLQSFRRTEELHINFAICVIFFKLYQIYTSDSPRLSHHSSFTCVRDERKAAGLLMSWTTGLTSCELCWSHSLCQCVLWDRLWNTTNICKYDKSSNLNNHGGCNIMGLYPDTTNEHLSRNLLLLMEAAVPDQPDLKCSICFLN